jgi:hypothetical protein
MFDSPTGNALYQSRKYVSVSGAKIFLSSADQRNSGFSGLRISDLLSKNTFVFISHPFTASSS